MGWSAQSPDLNLLEHAWGFLNRRLAEYEHPPKEIIELWERIQVEWDKIPVEDCQKLIESMSRRIQAVLIAKYQIPYLISKVQNCSNDVPRLK